MLISNLCDYSDANILVKRTITVTNTTATSVDLNNANNIINLKNCALFNNCISQTNNTQVDNNKDLDIVMLMYNLIEYSHNYAKVTGNLNQN